MQRLRTVIVAILASIALLGALLPAFAAPIPNVDEVPRVAFLARNDVPFDAQTAAAVAAQLGAPLFITPSQSLGQPARDGIAAFNPTVLIVAGGTAAISDAVANAAAEACNPKCTIDRRSGAGRDHTAADLAKVATDYKFSRPVLVGEHQVVGDAKLGGDLDIGGLLSTAKLAVASDDLVTNLNADLVDGFSADTLTRVASAHSTENSTGVGALSVTIEAPTAGYLLLRGGVTMEHSGANVERACALQTGPPLDPTNLAGSRRVVPLLDGSGNGTRVGSCETSGVVEVEAGEHTWRLFSIGADTVYRSRSLTIQFVPFDGAGAQP